MRKDDEALALLQGNDSPSGKLSARRYHDARAALGDAAKALLDLVGPPPKPGEVLSPRAVRTGWSIAAIAYSLAGDQTGLDRLAIDYSAAMADTPQNDTFRVLTQPEKTGQLRDIASAQTKFRTSICSRAF